MGNKKTKSKNNNYNINQNNNLNISKKTFLSEEDIKFLQEHTDYERDEILDWYTSFMNECPNGYLDKKTLIKTFEKIYPNGKPEKICAKLFNAFDIDKNSRVDFIEYLIGISHMNSFDLRKKLQLTFRIYDQNNNGRISRKEMEQMIKAILDLNGTKDRTGVNDPKEKVLNIFKKFKKDPNQSLNEDEFINGCLADDLLIDLLAEYRI